MGIASISYIGVLSLANYGMSNKDEGLSPEKPKENLKV